MSLVIGIDSSTQSTKAELRDIADGWVIAVGRASHPSTTPPISEQDPHAWWEATVSAIEQLGPRRAEAAALSVGGQQHGLVLLDDDDVVLRPAKLWNDTTSAAQAERLVESLGAQWWSDWTGVVPVAAFTISKLAWVADHEPDILGRTAKVMLPHDWLTYRLCGQHVTDRGDASGTGWYDATSNTVLERPLTLATHGESGWRERVPRVLQHDEPAGQILGSVASELGLSPDLIIGPGTGDNMAAALGLGLRTGDAALSLGTSGTVYARTHQRTHDVGGAIAGFCDANGEYLPLVCTLNATKVTDTVAGWLGTDAAGLAELALLAAPGSVQSVLIPYFDGERTPNRPDARGALMGLSTATTREELALAAHDGVLCGLLDGLSALEDAGVSCDGRLLLIGGGAKSPAYKQRLADITQRVVSVPRLEEAVATGAAVQAAMVYRTVGSEEVVASWNLDHGDVIAPTPDFDGAQVLDRYRAAATFDDSLCRPL